MRSRCPAAASRPRRRRASRWNAATGNVRRLPGNRGDTPSRPAIARIAGSVVRADPDPAAGDDRIAVGLASSRHPFDIAHRSRSTGRSAGRFCRVPSRWGCCATGVLFRCELPAHCGQSIPLRRHGDRQQEGQELQRCCHLEALFTGSRVLGVTSHCRERVAGGDRPAARRPCQSKYSSCGSNLGTTTISTFMRPMARWRVPGRISTHSPGRSTIRSSSSCRRRPHRTPRHSMSRSTAGGSGVVHSARFPSRGSCRESRGCSARRRDWPHGQATGGTWAKSTISQRRSGGSWDMGIAGAGGRFLRPARLPKRPATSSASAGNYSRSEAGTPRRAGGVRQGLTSSARPQILRNS